MTYDFDKVVDRLPFHSTKWNRNERPYERGVLLPLWVADNDFTSPEAVKAAVRAYAEHGLFGYADTPPDLASTVSGWLRRRHQWKTEESWISFTGGVVASLYAAVRACTAPGEGVIINSPAYPPFIDAVRKQGRQVLWNPLYFDGERYRLDFAHLRGLFAEKDKPKLMIFCSPHNPTGRVWEMEELRELGEIMIERDCVLLCDEIHFDLTWEGRGHISAGRLGPALMERLIMASAASKTFNVAGLEASYTVIPDQGLRNRFLTELAGGSKAAYIGKLALRACYLECDDYMEQMKDYVARNRDFVIAAIKNRLSPLKAAPPEGTCLVWIDCRGLGLAQEELLRWLSEDVRLRLNDGATFGPSGEGFVRLNLASPMALLEEAVERLEKALAKMRK